MSLSFWASASGPPPKKNCSAFEFRFLIIFTYIFNLLYNFWSRRGKKGVLGNLMNMFLHLYWGNGYRLFLFIRGFLTKKVNFYSISIKIKKNTYSINILISVEKIEKRNKIILKKHKYTAKTLWRNAWYHAKKIEHWVFSLLVESKLVL